MTTLEIHPDYQDDTKGLDGARFRFQFAVSGKLQTGVIYVTAPTLEAAVKIAGKRAGADVVTLHRKGFGI